MNLSQSQPESFFVSRQRAVNLLPIPVTVTSTGNSRLTAFCFGVKMQRMDQSVREKVFKRDNYTCRYCGNKEGPLHADHVYPFSRGGETSINNMVTSCESCNLKKSNKVGIYPLPIGYFEVKPKKVNVFILWCIFDLVVAFIALLANQKTFSFIALGIGLFVLLIGVYEHFFTNGFDWIEEDEAE